MHAVPTDYRYKLGQPEAFASINCGRSSVATVCSWWNISAKMAGSD